MATLRMDVWLSKTKKVLEIGIENRSCNFILFLSNGIDFFKFIFH